MDTKKLKIEIGEKVRQAREERGMSQEEVAAMLGLSKVGYGAIERGKNLLGLQHLVALVYILKKPVTAFLPASVVSDEEMADALLDPRLRYIVSNWPSLTEELQDLLARYVRLWLTTKRGRSDADQPEHE